MKLARGAGVVRRLVRCGHRRPRTTVVVALALILTGVVMGARLEFETDVLRLMPRDEPLIQEFERLLHEFRALETLLAAIPVTSPDDLETAFSLVDAVEAEFADSPYLTAVQGRLEDPVQLAEAVLRHAVLFLDQEALEKLAVTLSGPGLAQRAGDIRAGLETPHGMVAKELALRDPLGLLPLLLDRVSRAPASMQADFGSGYMLSADQSLVLLLARPAGPAQDIDFDRRLFADLDGRVERARARVAEMEGRPVGRVPEVLLGGGHRIALEDATLIRRDVITNSLTSLLGVMMLFFLAYRRLATAHFAFLPLAVGLAMTFTFAALTVGGLNSATAGFAALLVGLGIDFTIVMYGRYLEERHQGLDVAAALEAMAVGSGPAVLLGMATTAATFFAFLVTRFSGLRELGLLTGSGIILMAASSFVILPALVTLFDRDRPPARLPPWLHMGGVLRWCAGRRVLVIGLAGILLAGAVLQLWRVRFDDDVRHLRSPANRGVEIQEMVTDAFGLAFNTMMIRVEAPTTAELLERIGPLTRRLDALVEMGLIRSYESLAALVPPQEQQQAARDWLRANRPLTDPDQVERRFRTALAGHGLRPEAFKQGFDLLAQALDPDSRADPTMWRGTPAQQVVDRLLFEGEGYSSTVINIYPPPDLWQRAAPPELSAAVADVPDATLTGINLVSQRMRDIVWKDAGLAGVLGLVVVFLMLLWELRRIRDAAACLIPVVFGVVGAVALMAQLDMPLNLLNVFVMTMIIGVGSDYGIHVVHRYRAGATLAEIGETARAVVVAALTTMVGFGTLVATSYPGLQSIGWMTSFGVIFSCLAAVFVLPVLLRPQRD